MANKNSSDPYSDPEASLRPEYRRFGRAAKDAFGQLPSLPRNGGARSLSSSPFCHRSHKTAKNGRGCRYITDIRPDSQPTASFRTISLRQPSLLCHHGPHHEHPAARDCFCCLYWRGKCRLLRLHHVRGVHYQLYRRKFAAHSGWRERSPLSVPTRHPAMECACYQDRICIIMKDVWHGCSHGG